MGLWVLIKMTENVLVYTHALKVHLNTLWMILQSYGIQSKIISSIKTFCEHFGPYLASGAIDFLH
jgi:hypothetical protein